MFQACCKDAARVFCCFWMLCFEISLLVHWKHRGVSRIFRLVSKEQIFFFMGQWNKLLQFLTDLYVLSAKPSPLLR